MKQANVMLLAVAMFWLGLMAGESSDGGILALGLAGTSAIVLAEAVSWLASRRTRRRAPQA